MRMRFQPPGSGPSELRRPNALTADGDTLRIVDIGNGRLQTLTTTGAYVRSVELPAGAGLGPVAVRTDGWPATGAMGTSDWLAAFFDEEMEQQGTGPSTEKGLVFGHILGHNRRETEVSCLAKVMSDFNNMEAGDGES